jgi:DnaJ-domain-containing protein 1
MGLKGNKSNKGKLVGGAVGFAMGGPVGAIAGALFGHMFDRTNTPSERISSAYARSSDHAYAVLECAPADSDAKIKQAYRQKVREFHPDAIAAKGLPEEFIRIAHDKFTEIRNAYDMIQKERTQQQS